MRELPKNLYSVDSVVRLEQHAIKQMTASAVLPGYELMQRAGKAVYDICRERYPQRQNILVLCGAGNNAGDGYVVARLAKQAGLNVSLISLIDPATLRDEASQAYQDWLAIGENNAADPGLLDEAEIIIDALLGTGLSRNVSQQWARWIERVNRSASPVIAVDVPSGLKADTGVIAGTAIKAEVTVCFIGLKQGMFTAQGKDVCGEIIFDDLNVPEQIYTQVDVDARLISSVDYSLLPERPPSSHKGKFGHVLIIGGNRGMPGAAILSARAALRTGAGLVSVVTVAENVEAIISAVPEAMIRCCTVHDFSAVLTTEFMATVSHIAIGMGLAQDEWSLELLRFSLASGKPMLIDADALNLIARHRLSFTSPAVITPHPAEAARLLTTDTALSSADIQLNRFESVRRLHDLFQSGEPSAVISGAVISSAVILKGSGTLIYDGDMIKVCCLGNAAMAAPGMGDVLSGIVVALMAQKVNISDAAALAVCLHASAAQHVTQDKTRGLLASDVVDALQEVLR